MAHKSGKKKYPAKKGHPAKGMMSDAEMKKKMKGKKMPKKMM